MKTSILRKGLWPLFCALAVLAGLGVPIRAAPNQPITVSGSSPFDTVAAWFNPEHTEVEDEVRLRGSIFYTARTWKTGTHVDRITFHANAVDIHGTSETTGQRYRLNGSFSFDLRDPAVTYNPDGTFILPPQEFRLHFFKVDPEPARLDGYLGSVGSTAAASYWPATPTFNTTPQIYSFGVYGHSDGSTIFSGSSLTINLRYWPAYYPVQVHCRTGDQEASVIRIYTEWYRCTPIYSATEPVKVYAGITSPDGLITYTRIYTYHMVERPSTPQIRIYDDESSFLAAPSVFKATGLLPDLGAIDGSVTIGSVTFSLAPGGQNLYVGGFGSVPDWYPLMPGNEIAMGYESLQVTTETPVYALGFEFIEPNATMPLWGGTPVDSTYQVTLYSGTVQVGQFTFNAPDDVAPAFVGVSSDTAFDRAVITDITQSPFSDDDEYFGEFYAAVTPLP